MRADGKSVMPKYFHKLTLKDGRDVIVHTGHPAFVARVQPNGDGSIKPVFWLDEPPMDAMKMAAIMRRIGDWYASQINKS